jgi:hydrogenase-1 operon protein HyaF
MKLRDIPVVPLGPGSQPEEADGAELEYIDMPKGISTYSRPDTPEPEEVRDLIGAREAMDWLRSALADYEPDGEPQMANISRLDEANRDLVNQILGDGEVSAKFEGVVRARMQESVLAGIWRTFYLDENERITHDLLEVGDVPYLVRMPVSADPDPLGRLTKVTAPENAMNAMSIITEVAEHAKQFPIAKRPHSINLTLLPLSDEDIAFLDTALGRGPIDVLSRGYGDCRVSSTAIPNVWWVRYYNSVGTLILNTLEIIDVPGVACAALEDIRDSGSRLDEILEPYWAEMD